MHLKAENLSKNIGGNQIFKNLNIEVQAGEHVALVGRNGSGKTTLFQLLAGIEQPDEGRIIKSKGSVVGYLHQIPQFPQLTVYEVLFNAFTDLMQMQERLQNFERQMLDDVTEKLLHQYGELQEQFIQRGGYEIEAKISSIANGLGIKVLLESPFDDLSGGEKIM